MGNTATKEKADHIDGGALLPHGVYSGPQDYDFRIVQRLILQRRLAPFYKGLDDWEDSEDAQEEKERLLRATAILTAPASGPGPASSTPTIHMTESDREMKRLYQGAIECPICFLYYPRNINRTRCCDKPMCTECFVQLKRLESAPTESPACPYCVEPHFGIIYSPALLPTGLLSAPSLSLSGQTAVSVSGTSMSVSSSSNSIERAAETQAPSSPSTRRRSTSHKSPEVVTADELRPDWNRRILAAAQRQPGSRRASTSSSMNPTFSLGRRLAVGRQGGSSSRRSNSSTAATDFNGYLAAMRNMGTDLEELMIMEAMRQSLRDEHDRQSREEAAASASTPASGASTFAAANAAGVNSNSDPSGIAAENAGIHPIIVSPSGHGSRSSTGRMNGGSMSPLSSPIAPPSTSSSLSNTVQGASQGLRARSEEEDTASLTSATDDGPESEPDSDQDAPELLHNRAIRFVAVPIPAPNSIETGMPKHRVQEGPTNSPEAV